MKHEMLENCIFVEVGGRITVPCKDINNKRILNSVMNCCECQIHSSTTDPLHRIFQRKNALDCSLTMLVHSNDVCSLWLSKHINICKWMDVYISHSTSAIPTIESLQKCFSTQGIPDTMVFRQYCFFCQWRISGFYIKTWYKTCYNIS